MSKYLGCGVLFLVFVAGAVKADGLNSSIVAKPYVGFGAGISYSNDLYDNVKDDLVPMGSRCQVSAGERHGFCNLDGMGRRCLAEGSYHE